MKKAYFLALLLITLTTAAFAAEPSSQSQQGQAPPPGPGNRVTSAGLESFDRQFAMEAAMGGMTEVALGRLATQKASNAEVKRFGQRMVDDHTKANQELKQLASKKDITLPPDPTSGAASHSGHAGTDMQPQKGMHGGMTMDPAKHKEMMDKLAGLSGSEFDKEYMRGMLKDHDKTIALFEQQVSQGIDKDLQAFAKKTLPTLREHQRMAKQVAQTVGVTEAAR